MVVVEEDVVGVGTFFFVYVNCTLYGFIGLQWRRRRRRNGRRTRPPREKGQSFVMFGLHNDKKRITHNPMIYSIARIVPRGTSRKCLSQVCTVAVIAGSVYCE
jgi:hypothetical protein